MLVLIEVNIRFLSINCNFIRMSSSERRMSTCNSFLFQNFVHDEDLGLVVFSREKTHLLKDRGFFVYMT